MIHNKWRGLNTDFIQQKSCYSGTHSEVHIILKFTCVVSVSMLVQRKDSKDVTEGMADLLVSVDTALAVIGVVQAEVEIMQMLALWKEGEYGAAHRRIPTYL